MAGIAQAQGTEGKALDLCGLRPTFTEDFNDLKVSAWKIGDNRWIAHTPWNGDFGDAGFTNPQPDFPFTVNEGMLRIEARKDASSKWQSGLLASVDRWNDGFSQMYGYFEVRMKIPKGPGTSPAFWLGETRPSETPLGTSVEIDVIEFFLIFFIRDLLSGTMFTIPMLAIITWRPLQAARSTPIFIPSAWTANNDLLLRPPPDLAGADSRAA
jgi:hypothetical protein